MRLGNNLAFPLLLATQVVVILGEIPNCPYLGPVFPKPTNLASSDTIIQAVANLSSAFAEYENDPANNPDETSWSIQVFSGSDNDDVPIWEHYHTAPNINTSFASVVDGNTIYRLGSVTKIFTILAFLVGSGDKYWNAPVTDYIPELAQLAEESDQDFDPLMDVDWRDVTLAALASQMAGIVRDYGILGELTQENNQSTLMAQGFPPAPLDQVPPCGEYYLCTREQLFKGLKIVPPSWAPYTTPGYSNLGYQLLAYALENITGRGFQDILENDVLYPLNLEHTYYSKPPAGAPGIVPNGNNYGWSFSLGEASPTGNMYTSINDLSSLGRAIFRSTLIPSSMTRRWLQPAALTSEMLASVGYPWGIRRIQLGSGTDGNRVVDSYGKAGSINAYQSLLVLLPDYNVGISALLAGAWPGNANWDMADLIGNIMLPALEKTAQLQADAAYAGTYESSDLGQLNSSIILSTNSSRPGLGVDSWISNGTDMITVAVRYTLNYNVTYPMIRLYPTGLDSKNGQGHNKSRRAANDGNEGKKVAFKAVVENLDATDETGKMFSTDCGSWISQTAAVYADMPLDQFVFTFDDNGHVTHIENLALRAKLDKVQ
ncbi:putative Beta-lactamase-related domain-containing protein [Seiridium unicorne]|uniref:Beta-lactamase-related domain-containing protein n=1 Tax=Seiridium unicorne TaxID=138068 RepID=A0ABR2V2N6_9PEZI